jgi:hypothetical protein
MLSLITVIITDASSARDSSLLQNVQADSGLHHASCSMFTALFPRQQSGRGVKLTTHRHLVAMLRMSGFTLRLPLHALVASTGKNTVFTITVAWPYL